MIISLIDWSKQVVNLVQNEAFFPHPIRRELKSILELFNKKNLGHIKDKKGKVINLQRIVPWFTTLMTRYCEVFQLHCNVSGEFIT